MSKGACFTVSVLALLAATLALGLGADTFALFCLGLAIWVRPTYTELEKE